MSRNEPGGVYIVEHEHGYVKIGRSNNPVRRVAKLETACPYELTIRGVIETHDPPKVEARLHNRFAEYRKSGEWFKLPTREKMRLLKLCDLNATQVDAKYGRTEAERRRKTLIYQGLMG
jgi:hypothetical protein